MAFIHKHIVKHIDDAAMMTYRLSAVVAVRLNLAANHPELESTLPLLLISLPVGPRTSTGSLTLLCVPFFDGAL